MATSLGERLSEEVFDFQCTVCFRKNRVSNSEKFCSECQQHFCVRCLELHDKLHDDHSLQDPTQSSNVQLPTEKCLKHPTEVLKMFCRDHDYVGCSMCAINDHRTCSSVVDIPSAIQKHFASMDSGRMQTDLQNILSDFESGKSLGEEHAQTLDNERMKQIAAINDYVDTLVALVQKLGEDAKQRLLKAFKTVEDKYNNNQKACESTENEANTCLKNIETEQKNKAQIFVNMKKCQKVIQRSHSLLQERDMIRDVMPFFEKNCKIEQNLTKIQSLGGILSNKPVRYRWKKKLKINIKTKSDSKGCIISGSCLLPDGCLLFCDNANNNIKRLDPTSLTIIAQQDLPATPRGVCCISEDEAAVCLNNRTIQFVSLGATLTISRSININHDCFGIDFYASKLFMTNRGDDIMVHNIDGSLVKKGNLRLSESLNIVISESGEEFVYIADTSGLVCVNTLMKEQLRYNWHGLKTCAGVCVDQRGSVFISGVGSHNVVQVTETGQPLGVVVSKSDGVKSPTCLSWDNKRKRLYVAGRSNTMHVFEA